MGGEVFGWRAGMACAVLVELLPAACAVVDGDGGGVFARVDEVAEPVGACRPDRK